MFALIIDLKINSGSGLNIAGGEIEFFPLFGFLLLKELIESVEKPDYVTIDALGRLF